MPQPQDIAPSKEDRPAVERPTGPDALPGDLYNAPVPAENADPAGNGPDRDEGVANS